MAKIAVVYGSTSDDKIMQGAFEILDDNTYLPEEIINRE